jgi:hypothetical protein
MNDKRYFFKAGKAGCVLNTVLLMALTGWVGHADGQGVRITIPTPSIVINPPVVVAAPAVVVAPDNYVYYPAYGMYYNTTRHQYAYKDHDAWVSQSAPLGVSADVLLASPSVRMDFHDSPANHHDAMMKQYPKNYTAGRADHKIDSHDSHDSHEGHDDRK